MIEARKTGKSSIFALILLVAMFFLITALKAQVEKSPDMIMKLFLGDYALTGLQILDAIFCIPFAYYAIYGIYCGYSRAGYQTYARRARYANLLEATDEGVVCSDEFAENFINDN